MPIKYVKIDLCQKKKKCSMIENNLQKTEVTNNINLPSLSKEAEGFLCKIAAPALIAGSELLTIKFRLASLSTICEFANKYSKQLGIDIKPTPPKFLLPFIEKASLEDDNDLKKEWAKLLVSAGKEYDPIHLQYSNVLSQINGEEARLLKEIYQGQKDNDGFNAINQYDRATAEYNSNNAIKKTLSDAESRYNRTNYTFNNKVPKTDISSKISSPSFRYSFPSVIDGEIEKIDFGSYSYPMTSFVKSKRITNSVILLANLDLIKYNFECHSLRDNNFLPQWKLLLTEFGYKFVETIEDIEVTDDKTN